MGTGATQPPRVGPVSSWDQLGSSSGEIWESPGTPMPGWRPGVKCGAAPGRWIRPVPARGPSLGSLGQTPPVSVEQEVPDLARGTQGLPRKRSLLGRSQEGAEGAGSGPAGRKGGHEAEPQWGGCPGQSRGQHWPRGGGVCWAISPTPTHRVSGPATTSFLGKLTGALGPTRR